MGRRNCAVRLLLPYQSQGPRNLLNGSIGVSLGMSFFDLPPIIERMLLVSDKISDLNFSVGQLPQVEINGKLTPVQPLGL